MATFREIADMVLDLLKESSDDAFYTREHAIFLACRIRATLLDRKYSKSRNKSFSSVSDENMQTVCFVLEQTEVVPDGCEGIWLRSTEKMPETLDVSEPRIYAASDVIHSMVTWIPVERMPYVGYNKWLKNIIYATKSNTEDRLYLSSVNNQFIHLKKVKVRAVFSDPLKAAELECEQSDENCDILDKEFPLEESLVATCIELTVQEITGQRFAPEDKKNDASDGLSDVMNTNNNPVPVARSTSEQQQA